MNIVLFKRVFRLKSLESNGTNLMEKERCCVRGDFQAKEVELYPSQIYAPVASHESIRLILAIAEAEDLIFEGEEVDNAYLYD